MKLNVSEKILYRVYITDIRFTFRRNCSRFTNINYVCLNLAENQIKYFKAIVLFVSWRMCF